MDLKRVRGEFTDKINIRLNACDLSDFCKL